jgi:glucans biosynthesis protein
MDSSLLPRLAFSSCMLPLTLALGCAPHAAPREARTPAGLPAAPSKSDATHGVPGHFATLVERARAASKQPAQPAREVQLPASLRNVDWNTYRTIRYLPERSLWRGQPGHFEAQFFHLGFIYRTPVEMFVLDGGRVEELPFSPDRFAYDGVAPPPPGSTLGYAGLRLHTNLNSADYRDELVVFQGASYFRAVGPGNALGLSARALAVDTGERSPEEFPRFSELYLVRPPADARDAWVLGMLESDRLTGACAFHVQPQGGVSCSHTEACASTTVIDVELRVFMRAPVKALGLAPFSSMYLFGEAEPHRFGDVRPEVHDSDGLAIATTSGERIFRPLRNPRQTEVTEYRLDSPRGFGLVQRDRSADSYRPARAGVPAPAGMREQAVVDERYQDRPSAWVEPLGEWGPGKLRLLEIATALESDDNIALVWVPDQVPSDGLAVRYRLHFGSTVDGAATFGHVLATRLREESPERARFEIDFRVPAAAQLQRPVELELSTSDGQLLSRQVTPEASAGGFRASFDVLRNDPGRELELRAFLRAGSDVLTETWSYSWQAKS